MGVKLLKMKALDYGLWADKGKDRAGEISGAVFAAIQFQLLRPQSVATAL